MLCIRAKLHREKKKADERFEGEGSRLPHVSMEFSKAGIAMLCLRRLLSKKLLSLLAVGFFLRFCISLLF